MDQCFPYFRASEFPEVNGQITEKEYRQAINLAKKAGLKRLYQD